MKKYSFRMNTGGIHNIADRDLAISRRNERRAAKRKLKKPREEKYVNQEEARKIAEYAKDIVSVPDRDFAKLGRAYLVLEVRCEAQCLALEAVDAYFKSGNSVLVKRATIQRERC